MGLKKAGAAWAKEKNGRKFLSGQLELEGREGPKIQIFIFKNEDKEEGSKQPDYRIMVSDGEDDGPRRKVDGSDREERTPF